MKDEETVINFTREAFLHPLNLGLLFIATLTAFFLNDVGMVSNLILTMAFGTELVYLGIVPRLPRFKRSVKMRKLKERGTDEEEKLIFQELDSLSKRRYLVLRHLSKLIKENFDKLPYSSQGLLDSIRKKIGELLSNYITLLDLHKRYSIYMNSAVEDGLKVEVISLQEKMQGISSERLRNTKKRRLEILEKRLKKFELAKEKYLICETHLETIEDAIRFIYEQSMTMNNAEDVGFQLDNLLQEVEETSRLIEDLDQDILPGYDEFEAELNLEKTDSESEQTLGNKVKEQT
jgi:tRNA(Ser,Leu) C12 N-acetylase TAN1